MQELYYASYCISLTISMHMHRVTSQFVQKRSYCYFDIFILLLLWVIQFISCNSCFVNITMHRTRIITIVFINLRHILQLLRHVAMWHKPNGSIILQSFSRKFKALENYGRFHEKKKLSGSQFWNPLCPKHILKNLRSTFK